MAKKIASRDPPILRDVLDAARVAVLHLPGHRWCGVTNIKSDYPAEQIALALKVLAERGLVELGGDPPHSFILTAKGRGNALGLSK
jgi:hypothetical protein